MFKIVPDDFSQPLGHLSIIFQIVVFMQACIRYVAGNSENAGNDKTSVTAPTLPCYCTSCTFHSGLLSVIQLLQYFFSTTR
jgi:hypothetical protein